ncbi:MAG: hypothetical protein R2856_22640 [Caldilineaceae bacterium]
MVESTALRLLEEYKPGRNLKTNVEFYTALLLHSLGMETDLFTPPSPSGASLRWIKPLLRAARGSADHSSAVGVS